MPLLGIYPEKSIIQKDTCTPIFIAALFTTARSWKQTKCSSTEERINVHIYNGILLNHKMNKILPFADTWMDPETVLQSEVSQREKNKYCILMRICGI